MKNIEETNWNLKIIIRTLAVMMFGLILLAGSVASAVTITLTWSPNSENDLKGYRLYHRADGEDYDYNSPIWDGDKTQNSCQVEVADFETCYFVLRAYNTLEIESNNSNQEMYKPEDMEITSPSKGDVLASGSTTTIQWHTAGITETIDQMMLWYSTTNGSSWKLVDHITGDPGEYENWTVPVPRKNKTKCLFKLIAYDAAGQRIGKCVSGKFTIEVVKLTAPDTGVDPMNSQDLCTITWQTNQTFKEVSKVLLKYTLNNGKKWKKIETLTDNPGTFDWIVPTVQETKTRCRVKVFLKDSNGKLLGRDRSDEMFTIDP